jgi:Xaa-Pro dipeptidase
MSSQERIARLANELESSGADAFLAWAPVSMGYLHGYFEGGGERFLTLAVRKDGTYAMICPALSETQARRTGIQDVRGWRDGEDPMVLFRRLAEEWNLRSSIIAVDDGMPAHMLLKMQEALPAALFKQGQEVISRLMQFKTEQELDYMRQAARIADDSYPAALAALKPGITENELAAVITGEMRRRGGQPIFCIIAAGAAGAEPHHHNDDTPIKEGDVVIMDFGCSINGYLSDITRTACCGAASGEAKQVYDVVYRAQEAARFAIHPGVTCHEIDNAARKVIEDAGYGEYFVHRTGHGIGMRGHEEPFIVAGNDTVLQPGHCFSVEPGIYLPGKFGVRIENIVTVTESGHESLNAEPDRELREVR